MRMEKQPATTRSLLLSMGGRMWRNHLPKAELRILSGSAARAKKGKTEETPTNCRIPLPKIRPRTAANLIRP
jgi:hypothetical protein